MRGLTDADIDRELVEETLLCHPDGTLRRDAIGWSRRPLHTANLGGRRLRQKKWEYFCVTTDTHVLAVTYADLGYLGLAETSLLEVETRTLRQHVVPVPGARGFRQPETVRGAPIRFEGAGLRLGVTEEEGGTRLSVRSRRPLAEDLEADVFIALPEGHETLSVVVPWDERHFQLTSKHQCRPAEGYVRWGHQRYDFGPDEGAFGCLDFGRGVWPYRTTWNWASASGRVGGRTLGFNLGGQWTDGTGTTENAVVVDGRLHRVGEPVTFLYDRRDFQGPWHLRSPSGAVALTFRPCFERAAVIPLGVLSSAVHQCFGHFEGTLEAHGETHTLDGLFGWSEEHRARW